MREMIKGKHLAKGCVTVDRKTGKTTPSKGTMMMMPAKEGTCSECAVEHDPTHPHNAQSMFYQYKFFNEFGRWPDWKDAMKHCPKEIKAHWMEHLEKLGVNVKAGHVNPR